MCYLLQESVDSIPNAPVFSHKSEAEVNYDELHRKMECGECESWFTAINPRKLRLEGAGRMTYEFAVVDFEREVSSKVAHDIILDEGWVPAHVGHILTFLQFQFFEYKATVKDPLIVGLGTKIMINNSCHVLALDYKHAPKIRPITWKHSWTVKWRFLAVRPSFNV